jgi:hypothetical protein
LGSTGRDAERNGESQESLKRMMLRALEKRLEGAVGI